MKISNRLGALITRNTSLGRTACPDVNKRVLKRPGEKKREQRIADGLTELMKVWKR